MSIAITIIHVLACLFLIAVVLLQTGKGADAGAVFGGSSQTIFGSAGAGNLLTRLTTGTAVVFMLTSIFLTWSTTSNLTDSILDDTPAEPPALSEPAPLPSVDATAPVAGAGDAAKVDAAAAVAGAATADKDAPSAAAPADAPAKAATDAPDAKPAAAAAGKVATEPATDKPAPAPAAP